MVLNCGCSCEDKAMSFDSFDDSIMDRSTYVEESPGMDLLVTVPKGYREGNIVYVKSPFGTRKAEVLIPPGYGSGQQFRITLPHPAIQMEKPSSPNFSVAVENMLSPRPVCVGKMVDASSFAKLHSDSFTTDFSY
uniref:Uncharacterized protein n=1 Tax=Entomoneis paludosa TaxID=265537 RepID=A0A7S2YMX8_9STRA|mmetsp:Transcript_39215/g.81389  ORF Transcript_39215/g.81389 Transcript_39215/m.81389 type:complete len:135 (+) Transcript_39215:155-559(+)|eukprot:CAMPEP_0172456218 /NCGR_PEP_ID=MMETSP1065-20121228/14420_1 /TAXON_ID=265537 /ORGANISM="Amphiprora paludosa, Strain CCMP125" /LENGTH=134 /DNA_ID=CAMNT_0013208979 /DNA_START=123 /DNA_END=527 /DNA_ORIENTATION=+